MRWGILSVAGYGRPDGQTGSLGQFVLDVSCSFWSGRSRFVATDEDGLGGLGFAVRDYILAVPVFNGCGSKDGRIFTTMQPFLLK